MKEKIRRCKYCKSEIRVKVGVHNWKNLFKKPTLEEGITFFIILMLIVSAYAYKSDLNNIINYYENETYCNTQRNLNLQEGVNPLNLTSDTLVILMNHSNLSIKENG